MALDTEVFGSSGAPLHRALLTGYFCSSHPSLGAQVALDTEVFPSSGAPLHGALLTGYFVVDVGSLLSSSFHGFE